MPTTRIAALCRGHGVRWVWFFGSVPRDGFASDGGVDVLVEFEPVRRVGPRFHRMELEPSDILGRKADPNTAGFLSRIFRDGELAEAEVVDGATR